MGKFVLVLCANLKGNLGDFAILEAMGLRLREAHGGLEVRFFYHGNKAPDQERLACFLEESRTGLVNLGPAPFRRRPRWFRLLRSLLGGAATCSRLHNRQILKTARMLEDHADFAKAVAGAEAVYFAGGSQWGRGDLNMNMFAQLCFATSLNRRVFAYPFALTEGALSCNGTEALREFFARLNPPVPVRDVISSRVMKSAGFDPVLVSDVVFTMEAEFRDLRSQAVKTTGKVYISVTQTGDTTADSIVRLCGRLEDAGLEPVVFSSCELEDWPLIDAVRSVGGVETCAPQSWKESVRLFADADFVVTNRLHCLIFSALAGTAVVPVANRQKPKAYAEDAGLEIAPQSLNELDADQIKRVLDGVVVNRQRQAAYLETSAERTRSVLLGLK